MGMVSDAGRVDDSSRPDDHSTAAAVRQAGDRAREWVLVSRVRVFGAAAGATALLLLVSVAVPSTAVSLFFAGLLAAVTMILALLALATWWADRTGRTDSADLWDAGPPDTAHAEDLLDGFGFTEDGRLSR